MGIFDYFSPENYVNVTIRVRVEYFLNEETRKEKAGSIKVEEGATEEMIRLAVVDQMEIEEDNIIEIEII